MKVSFVIPTRNRVDELRAFIRSALAQTVRAEILVMDDGNLESTATMLAGEFPQVIHHRLGIGRGPAFQRNRGIELASCEIVFPLDDDALLVSPRTVEQTLAEFDNPRIGAVGIPYMNVRHSRTVLQRAPDAPGIHLTHAFVGAAHAVRRDVFLRLGGFREHFFYMGEEGDFCLRMLNAGFVTRLGAADAIEHHESPKRDTPLADRCGRRNDVLFAWHNTPCHWLPAHLGMTSVNGLRAGIATRHPLRMLGGTLSGYGACWKHRHERAPVSSAIYRLHRRLKKSGPVRLDQIESVLPPLPF